MIEREEIKKYLMQAAGTYRKVLSEKELQEYIEQLSKYSDEEIKKATIEACKVSRQWFPAPQKIAHEAMLTRKQTNAQQARVGRQQREYRSDVRLDPSNPFARLAKLYAEDSTKRNLNPDRPAPPDVAKRRFDAFWAVWKFYEKTKEGEKHGQTNKH